MAKMASIELTPEKPEFSAGSCHTGQDTLRECMAQIVECIGGLARSCTQNYGDVDTPEGHLLAFPNVFQHGISSFKLHDPTKPGHRHFIDLWLADPHRRILSTANVPPQQKDRWTGSGEVPKGLMNVEEARAHRLKLLDERTAEKTRALWESIDYNFCEH
ncbi:uncharacterized protein FSUBG_7708 [Fusarium subglutinans]|uniref:DUF4246 domain-containing protein n=1 Tax=Gibberella subglutinans TaxID=42677 RepID=A0A8H5UX14_GIBSU|nr:uncharacterized protein FSUBG_7708 [Fusarium subglutinans]KAF5602401.1 hypothetical protein FSUBG_7708 [Fusarium subglutinans]